MQEYCTNARAGTDACRGGQTRLLSLIKVTPDLRGCPRGKIRTRAILKENTANYTSLESLINVDFEKKLGISSIPQKKIANNHENDHVSFN